MRRVFNGLVTVAVVLALSAPVYAKATRETTKERSKPKAVKTVRGWVQVVFDLISDPKP